MLFGCVILIHHLELFRPNQPSVPPRQANGLATGLINQPNDVLLHLPGKYPFDDLHRFLVSHPHALNKVALFPQTVQCRFNLRSATMYNNGIHAHQFQQYNILRKVRLQGGVCHGVSTIFDHHGFAMKFAYVGERLRQNLGFIARAYVRQVWVRDKGHKIGNKKSRKN